MENTASLIALVISFHFCDCFVGETGLYHIALGLVVKAIRNRWLMKTLLGITVFGGSLTEPTYRSRDADDPEAVAFYWGLLAWCSRRLTENCCRSVTFPEAGGGCFVFPMSLSTKFNLTRESWLSSLWLHYSFMSCLQSHQEVRRATSNHFE